MENILNECWICLDFVFGFYSNLILTKKRRMDFGRLRRKTQVSQSPLVCALWEVPILFSLPRRFRLSARNHLFGKTINEDFVKDQNEKCILRQTTCIMRGSYSLRAREICADQENWNLSTLIHCTFSDQERLEFDTFWHHHVSFWRCVL